MKQKILLVDTQPYLTIFERWFNGDSLTGDEQEFVILSTATCVLFIIFLVLLTLVSIKTLFWTRIGWFFEDLWHWVTKR